MRDFSGRQNNRNIEGTKNINENWTKQNMRREWHRQNLFTLDVAVFKTATKIYAPKSVYLFILPQITIANCYRRHPFEILEPLFTHSHTLSLSLSLASIIIKLHIKIESLSLRWQMELFNGKWRPIIAYGFLSSPPPKKYLHIETHHAVIVCTFSLR